jgi:flagella synthesis protein FlgN
LTHTISNQQTAHLLSHLKNEVEALRAFVILLETEQQTLLTQDSDHLIELAESKTQSASNIAELSNARHRLMNLQASDLDTTAWIEKNAPSCRGTWDEVRSLATRAHHINQTNGEVIQLKLRSNQKALTALLGASQNAAGLYGRDGQPNLPVSGRTLGNG